MAFATPDDFLQYWGYNLTNLLRSNNNDSVKAETFLFRVEHRLMTWIDANTFRNINFDELTDFQREQMKYAVLEQAMYMWRNGDLGMDSGYDQERGKVMGRGDLNYLEICQPALNCLKLAGIFNQKMKNYRRTLHGWGASLANFTNVSDKIPPAPTPSGNVISGIGYTEDD